MKDISYPFLITVLLMVSSSIVRGKIQSDGVVKNNVEQTECTQTDAQERDSFVIADLKTALFEQGTIKRETEGFISVEKVKQLKDFDHVILVDIRNAELFSAFRIPQSINIKARQLTSKSFLKNKIIVLINEGFSITKMNNLYQELLASGFKQVNVLDGGLNAWKQAGEKLDSVGVGITQLNWILSQQFFLERKYKDLIVLNVTESTLRYSQKELTQLLQKELLNKSGHKTPKENRILIVNEDGKGYEKIQQAVTGLAWHRVFFLQGGKKAYQNYLAGQQAMWNRSTVKQGKVNTCGRRKR